MKDEVEDEDEVEDKLKMKLMMIDIVSEGLFVKRDLKFLLILSQRW